MDTTVCTLESLAQKSTQLFTLPTVAMEVLDLTANREVDVEKIRVCIEKDPALVAKLLRVVNSSLFCTHGVVRDLRQALTLIGLNPLRLLVLGFCLPERLLKGISENVLAWYWRQTLTKAVAAREFAIVACPILADEVFVAGLLRDIGMLLLIQELDKPYLKLVNQAISAGVDVKEIEKRAMGFDHVQLSFKMMEGWGFPASLQERNDPLDSDGFDSEEPGMAPRLLCVAKMVADLLASERTSVLPALLEESRRLLQIDDSQTEGILDSIEEKVRQLANVLSLKLPQNLDYHSLLATARDRLILAADEAAGNLVQDGNHAPNSSGTSSPLKKAIKDDILRKSQKETPQADATQGTGEKPGLDRVEQPEADPSKTDGEPCGEKQRAAHGVDSASQPSETNCRVETEGIKKDDIKTDDIDTNGIDTGGINTDALIADVHSACGAFLHDRDEDAPVSGEHSVAIGRSNAAGDKSSRPSDPDVSPTKRRESSTAASNGDSDSAAPHEGALLKQLRTATAACHRLRCPASLLAVDFGEDPETLGSDNVTILNELLRLACQTSCGDQKILLEFKQNGRARDPAQHGPRDEAVSTAHQVLESFQHAIPFCFGSNAPDVTIDLGVVTLAMPPAEYDPNRFVDAVTRCLYASHASGGNRVKSVDIG